MVLTCNLDFDVMCLLDSFITVSGDEVKPNANEYRKVSEILVKMISIDILFHYLIIFTASCIYYALIVQLACLFLTYFPFEFISMLE